jgi:hypothetical protein
MECDIKLNEAFFYDDEEKEMFALPLPFKIS